MNGIEAGKLGFALTVEPFYIWPQHKRLLWPTNHMDRELFSSKISAYLENSEQHNFSRYSFAVCVLNAIYALLDQLFATLLYAVASGLGLQLQQMTRLCDCYLRHSCMYLIALFVL